MKSKGFTLIELLAVIVILAIIALIATPIVLNIIKGSKESATIRSAEYYLDAVELGVARAKLDNITIEDGEYTVQENGNICLEGEVSNCTKVDVSGEIPDNGIITITNGKITNINLTYDGKVVVKENDKLVFSDAEDLGSDNPGTICMPATSENKAAGNVPTGLYKAGDAYICKVKDDMESNFKDGYRFYVLSTNNASNEIITENTSDKNIVSVNLILDRNIYYNSDSDKGLATETNPGYTNWINQNDHNEETWAWKADMGGEVTATGTNIKGPITAMNYLHNATKDWNYIEDIIINYDDEGPKEKYGINNNEGGYGGIKTLGINTSIYKSDKNTVTATYKNLKARMPMFKEVANYNAELNNQYLYDNLYYEKKCWESQGANDAGFESIPCDSENVGYFYVYGMHVDGMQHINGANGYWLMSSSTSLNGEFILPMASMVSYSSEVVSAVVDTNYNQPSIRPVITVSIDKIADIE